MVPSAPAGMLRSANRTIHLVSDISNSMRMSTRRDSFKPIATVQPQRIAVPAPELATKKGTTRSWPKARSRQAFPSRISLPRRSPSCAGVHRSTMPVPAH